MPLDKGPKAARGLGTVKHLLPPGRKSSMLCIRMQAASFSFKIGNSFPDHERVDARTINLAGRTAAFLVTDLPSICSSSIFVVASIMGSDGCSIVVSR